MKKVADKFAPLGAAAAAAALAFFAAPTAWILLQQTEGGITYLACAHAGVPLGAGLALGALLVCVAAGAAGWRISATFTSATWRFVGRISAGLAAIFAVAVIFLGAAVWLIPPCAR